MNASSSKEALRFRGRSTSFGELDELSRRYARGLTSLGVMQGDRVAVLAESSPSVVVALLGHHRLGVVHVPVNPRYRAAEVRHILRDSGAAAVLYQPGSEGADILDALESEGALAAVRRIALDADAPVPAAGSASGASSTSYVRLLASSPLEDSSRAPLDEDTAVLVYTSGTTGTSKGVALSTRAIVENVESLTHLWRFGSRDVLALALPLFHVHGLFLGILGALLHGMKTLLFERFDAVRIVEAFASEGASVFMGVPTMYVKLLEAMAARPEAAAALGRGRLFTSGSAPLPADDFHAFEAATGHRILERYGMTETLFTLSNPYDGERRPGTVGQPVPGCAVRVVDDAGQDAPNGELGELVVQSNGLMTRYWGRPDDTAASFRDGWFMTGDMAHQSPDGHVTIAGRKAVDFIKSGGFKISTREVEDVLRRHSRVADVAVFGAPDRVFGERVAVAVVMRPAVGPRPDDATLLAELYAFAARSLTEYKLPREIVVLDELPRNALGKVQKHLLRPR
ncbi:MAG: AMP-binding protein [Thermoanaerobaculia bacterium]